MHYDMMKEIPKLFGLKHFQAGPEISLEPSEGRHFTIKFYVTLLWAAEVYYFARPIVVAILHTDGKQYQGVLVDIADTIENHSLVVDLGDWDDPVQRALQSINLAPSDVDLLSGYSSIVIHAEQIKSDIKFSMDSSEPSLAQLAKALLETIGKIAALYGGQYWHWFLKSSRDGE